METQIASVSDQSAENTLLVLDEFKRLLKYAQRLEDYDDMLYNVAIHVGLLAISVGALASIWLGPAGPIGCTVSFLLILWGLMRGLTAYAVHRKPTIARLIKLISDTQDAEMLGPILDLHFSSGLLTHVGPNIRKTVDSAVLRLLPMITTAHAGSLNTQQRERLHSYWFHNEADSYELNLDNVPYMLELIRAFEQIGDKRDLPEIERHLRSVNRLKVARKDKKDLIASLQRCRNIVAERAAREEGKDFLLRPDSNPEPSEDLLRPASESADKAPKQLLRSSSDDSVPPS